MLKSVKVYELKVGVKMQEVSLKTAKNNLTTYDLICSWDICTSDGTVRMVQDSFRPEIINRQMEYLSMLNWLAENFIFQDDRDEFCANLDLEVLKKLEEDKYFSVRTRFPDARVRKFAYLLSPSIINKQDHVYFSIFDLDNDIEDIKDNPINDIPLLVKSTHSSDQINRSFMPFYFLVAAMFIIAISGIMDYVSPVFCIVGVSLFAVSIIYVAYNICHSAILIKSDSLEKLNEIIVKSAKNMSKVISAEKAVNISRSRFLSCVSQDFRTPMNSVVGMTVLANKKIENTEYVRDCLQKIARENTSMVELIDSIVDISEAEAGKMQLNSSTFSLQELVVDLLDSIADEVLNKKINFDIRNHNIRREYLIGDEARIKNIFRQLTTNAIKYTPEGGRITIDIKEEGISGNRDSVRLIFIVEDNGYGISTEYKKEMYTAFSRADDNKIQKIKGTGLGLALTKHLVDLMDGTIVCDSKENSGTKFTVSIDLPVTGMDSNDMKLDPMKVLLIDDDKQSLDCAIKMFNEMGGHADGVESIKKAFEILQNKCDYSLIAIDCHMEKVHTSEAIRNIRACVGNDVTILLASSFSSKHLGPELFNVADGFVQKPCFKSEIFIDMLKYNSSAKNEPKIEHVSEMEDIKLDGMNILIAEDNDLNWEIMNEILETVGATSVRAENGFECVDKMYGSKDDEFDVILMDIQMPVMNGIAATEEIRKSKREYVRSIPIIAMTADSFTETVKECRAAGMDGYVTKPVDLSKLFVELHKLKEKIKT